MYGAPTKPLAVWNAVSLPQSSKKYARRRVKALIGFKGHAWSANWVQKSRVENLCAEKESLGTRLIIWWDDGEALPPMINDTRKSKKTSITWSVDAFDT